jgi:hypothetical protein
MPIQPEGSTLYVSAPLTTISTAYAQNGNWMADQVFPNVPVSRQGDLYWRYPQGAWRRSIAGLRAPATESVGGGWDVTTDSYYANVYAVHKDVDDQTLTNARGGGFDLYSDATNWVTENLLLKRDQLFASTYLTTGVWTGLTTDQVGVVSAPAANQFIQFDQAASDPIGVMSKAIIAMAKNTGYRPNVVVMGPSVYNALLNNSEIIARVVYTGGGFLTESVLQQALGVDKIVVTWSTQNTAPLGATDAYSFVNDKSLLLVYAAPQPGLQTLSGGYIFTWDGLLGSGSYGTRIKSFRQEQIESQRIEGEMAFAMKVVASDVGVFFTSVVA